MRVRLMSRLRARPVRTRMDDNFPMFTPREWADLPHYHPATDIEPAKR
jgi:hypothetical protein